MSDLARSTGLHRPALYKLLPHLEDRGLIERKIKGKRVFYVSTGKKVFQEWQSQQEREFSKQFDALPNASEDYRSIPGVVLYKGSALTQVWEDILASKRGTVFYRYDGYSPSIDVNKKYLPKNYYEIIDKHSLERFVITNHALRHSHYKRKIECESKILPKSFNDFEQGVSQFIYGDKIALVDFTTETAYVIENKALAEYHRQLFRFLLRFLDK